MIVVKVWCLPNETQDELKDILDGVTRILASIPKSGVTGTRHVLILFPKDQMAYGLGTEILVEVGFTREQDPSLYLPLVASGLLEFFRVLYLEARVHVVVRSFDYGTVVSREFLGERK